MRVDVIAALREAFDAGVSHGEDSATAYEWGSRPTHNRDQMFEDCIAPYNGEASPIQKLLALFPVTPAGGGQDAADGEPT